MIDLLKSLRRARRMFDDPTKGIEYNKLVPNRRVSRDIYGADIARNPQIVGDDHGDGFRFIDVQAEARLVNFERVMIDRETRRARGRAT